MLNNLEEGVVIIEKDGKDVLFVNDAAKQLMLHVSLLTSQQKLNNDNNDLEDAMNNKKQLVFDKDTSLLIKFDRKIIKDSKIDA